MFWFSLSMAENLSESTPGGEAAMKPPQANWEEREKTELCIRFKKTWKLVRFRHLIEVLAGVCRPVDRGEDGGSGANTVLSQAHVGSLEVRDSTKNKLHETCII